jgi:hypothetical protein
MNYHYSNLLTPTRKENKNHRRSWKSDCERFELEVVNTTNVEVTATRGTSHRNIKVSPAIHNNHEQVSAILHTAKYGMNS